MHVGEDFLHTTIAYISVWGGNAVVLWLDDELNVSSSGDCRRTLNFMFQSAILNYQICIRFILLIVFSLLHLAARLRALASRTRLRSSTCVLKCGS
jgi:hypothetical protein